MPGISNRVFRFDEWKKLAEENPEAFEFTRRFVIDSLIAEANDSDRMMRLQWRIDRERERAKTPMASCVRLSNMMLNSFYSDTGFSGVLQGRSSNRSSGDVIEMKRHTSTTRK